MVSDIIGHQSAIHKFRKALGAHAFLFVGPDSVGKFATAWMLSGEIAGCSVSDNRACPDRIVVEPRQEMVKGVIKEKPITVSDIRDALHELSLLPYGKRRRVLVVRDAHRLTEEAQNALLKTLEEPPGYATIILTTHMFGHLLPTIHSRCQRIDFFRVPLNEIRSAIGNESHVPDLLLSLGRPGLVKHFLGDREVLKEDLKNLSDLNAMEGLLGKERLTLSEKLSRDTVRLARLLDWWICLLESRGAIEPSRLLLAEKVSELLGKVRMKSGNARLLLDELFVSL